MCTSVGSCYDSSTHVVTCNVEDDDCSGYWYAPGYASSYSGCCHCQASCGNVTADCADNYYDAGSCIDGRLTSAWNWCSTLSKKPFYHLFHMAGFDGFDGDMK